MGTTLGWGSMLGNAVGNLGGPIRPAVSQQQQPQSNSMLDQLNSFWNLGQLANAPNTQAINNNIASYQQQLGLLGANQQTQTGYINQDKATNLAKLGLTQQGNQNDLASLLRQQGLLPRQHQLAMDALFQQQQEAQAQSDQQNRALSSQGTVQGNTVSVGHRQGIADIAQQLGFANYGLKRAREQTNMSFEEQNNQFEDRKKQLALAAKGTNLDQQQFETQANRALSQLGLDTVLKSQDIARAINDLNAGRYNPLQSLLGQIYQVSGLRPVSS